MKYIPLSITNTKRYNRYHEVVLLHGDDEYCIVVSELETTIHKNLKILETIKGAVPDPVSYLQNKLFFQWLANEEYTGLEKKIENEIAYPHTLDELCIFDVFSYEDNNYLKVNEGNSYLNITTGKKKFMSPPIKIKIYKRGLIK